MIITETDRLYLRELRIEDAEKFYLLNLDPEVIRYTGDPPFKNRKEAEIFLMRYDQYEKYRLGRWAVIRKADNEFTGWCGLKYTPELDEYDIGFRFYKKYWNRGYATEAASACIHLGFRKFNIRTIVGRAMKKNTPSIRVLKKVGMTFSKEFDFDGHEGVIYIIENPLHNQEKTTKEF